METPAHGHNPAPGNEVQLAFGSGSAPAAPKEAAGPLRKPEEVAAALRLSTGRGSENPGERLASAQAVSMAY